MIHKLLVANRGEIAVRVIRAAREMGIRTVAVYSDADAGAAHVALADEAVAIGPPEPSASYLDAGKILDAARATGADAVHPGYGFLSERAEFAEACEAAGIVFVGPPASAMRLLGGKSEAKALAVRVGVPIVPGHFEKGATAEELQAAAEGIGYPVMLKASAGGGGRGMRAVWEPARFMSELELASEEALKAFGDGSMLVEKLVERPRHVEVQLLADAHGNVAPLFERECSLQRRHQKIVEEAPFEGALGVRALGVEESGSPNAQRPAPNALWPAMRDAARNLAREAGYVGAGTAEFMVDEASGEFYFLEVNARLQVEHPVTEMVTGIDLVQWQLRIAAGERLDLSPALMEGDRAALKGHAIEARIVAEDPGKGFLPSIGRILAWAEPKAPGVRVDSGFGPGGEVSRYYDSLLAKVIAHAETREAAIERLRAALMDFHVLGVKTNVAYLLDVLDHPSFRAGNIDTGFLGREFADWTPGAPPAELASLFAYAGEARGEAAASAAPTGAWGTADGFRNARA